MFRWPETLLVGRGLVPRRPAAGAAGSRRAGQGLISCRPVSRANEAAGDQPPPSLIAAAPRLQLPISILGLPLLAVLALAACGPSAAAPAPSKPAAPAQSAAPAQPAAGQQAPAAAAKPAGPPVVLRWSTIENANQAYIPILLRDKGIGAKYGLDVQ